MIYSDILLDDDDFTCNAGHGYTKIDESDKEDIHSNKNNTFGSLLNLNLLVLLISVGIIML